MARQAMDRTPPAAAHIGWLDHLRWLAAGAVALQHIRGLVMLEHWPNAGASARAVYFISGFGKEAVAIFFVLSGYLVGARAVDLMRSSTAAQRDRFALARFARIFGVLWPALALTLVVALAIWHSPLAGRWQAYGPDARATDSPLRWIATALMLNEVSYRFDTPFNNPLWSLACEWLYYCCAMAGIYLAASDRRRAVMVFCGYTLLFVTATIVFNPRPILLGSFWLFGLLAAKAPAYRLLPVTLGGFLLALVVSRMHWLGDFPGYLVLAAATALLLGDRSLRARAPLPTTGKALAGFSFSLYAIHWPVALAVAALANALGLFPARLPPGALANAWIVAIMTCAYAAAWVFSRFAERNGGWLAARIRALTRT